MGCCIPNSRSANLVKSNIIKSEELPTIKLYTKNSTQTSVKASKKESNNNSNINKNDDGENNKNLKLSKNQPITTNINNINININQISKNSDVKSNENEEKENEEKKPKFVKPELNSLDRQILKEIFSNHFLFKNKSLKLISSIIESLEMMVISKNTILFKKGDKGDYFYVIKEGKIMVQKH